MADLADLFPEFSSEWINTSAGRIFARVGGSGPPLLLLHGFSETHVMWHRVAPRLAASFKLIIADPPGYGWSDMPESDPDHTPYTKRAMARTMIEAMEQLGHVHFAMAGHDRGGRVAYRLALDHPDRVERLAVLDILPTETAWGRADARFALGYWPWVLLAQPEPLPERMLSAAPEAVIDNALSDWGSPSTVFPREVKEVYVEALRDPAHIHAICEEYRAAATLDREHDRADRAQGRRMACPLLVVWSARGGLETWYAESGGPIEIWGVWSAHVEGHALDAGHFFPEEAAEQTAHALSGFFAPE